MFQLDENDPSLMKVGDTDQSRSTSLYIGKRSSKRRKFYGEIDYAIQKRV